MHTETEFDLGQFFKETGFTCTKKGQYELKYNGEVISGSAAKIRAAVRELRDTLEKEWTQALAESNPGSKANREELQEQIAEVIEEIDVSFSQTDAKYFYWVDKAEVEIPTFAALAMGHDCLSEEGSETIFKRELRKAGRVYSGRMFDPQEQHPKFYNTTNLIYKGLLDIDLTADGECVPETDLLFEAVSGGCPISKKVLEQCFVAHHANTVNKNLNSRLPVIVCFGDGGAGRSQMFIDFASKVFGDNNVVAVSQSAAGSDFNGYLEGKRLAFYNEMKGVSKEKFTETIKSYNDSRIMIHAKQKEAKQTENITWYVTSANGSDGPILLSGDAVDRRFQVCEGKIETQFRRLCLKNGFVDGINKDSLHESEVDSDLELKSQAVMNIAQREDNVIKHMQYLYRKHYEELSANGFKVVAVKNEAYRQLLRNQAAAWVAPVLQYIVQNVKPVEGGAVGLSVLYDTYKIACVGNEKFTMKPEKFEQRIKSLLENTPDLRYFKFNEKRGKISTESGRVNAPAKSISINFKDYEDMIKSQGESFVEESTLSAIQTAFRNESARNFEDFVFD